MLISEKKKQELAHLEKALNLLQFQDYSITEKDRESPDFLIEISGRPIGVEVTSIYRDLGDDNAAKTQSDIPIIVENAVQTYNDKGGTPLVFAFNFDGTIAISNRNKFAIELGDFLYEYTRKHFSDGIDSIRNISLDKTNYNLSPFVRSIFAKPTKKSASVGFETSGFDSVIVVNSILENALRKKETLLPKYKENCDVIWLLITLPSMQSSSDYELRDNQVIKLSHNFDAVYVLDDYRSLVMRIENV